jgi:hypothetical protein
VPSCHAFAHRGEGGGGRRVESVRGVWGKVIFFAFIPP